MSFFDRFMALLGFESQEQKPQEKKKSTHRASFNLKSGSHNKRLPATRNISSQDQVVAFLEELKKKGSIIVDLSGFEKGAKIRAFDFISGAVYALGGVMKKMEPNKYLCTLDELEEFLENQDD
jgi:cell division inhibitor SepF